MILGVAALSILIVGGVWSLRSYKQARDNMAAEALAAIAVHKKSQLSAWIQDQKDDALVLEKSLFFMTHAAGALEDPESPLSPFFEEFLRYVAFSHDEDDVVLVDGAGRVRFSLRGSEKISAEESKALKDAVELGRPVMTDLYRDSSTQEIQVSVAIPVTQPFVDPPKSVGGALLITKASRMLDPVVHTWPVPSQSAEVFLVRRDGDHVLYLSERRHHPNSALTLRVPLDRTDLPEVLAVRGELGVVRGTDDRGAPVLAAVAPVEGTPLFLVVKEDRAELHKDSHVLAVSGVVHLAGLAALLAFVVFWARQRGEKRHYRRLYQAESELRKTLTKHALVLQAMQDAVITTDAQNAVELCNPAAEALTEWTAAEAQGKPLVNVFQIVGEKDREVIEDPLGFILAKAPEGRLSETFMVQTRTGRLKHVAVEVSVLRDEAGTFTGTVFCCRDQTEEFLRRRILEIRVNLMERSHLLPLEESLSESLDAVGDLLQSPVGFYGSVDARGERFGCTYWSCRVSRDFCPNGPALGHHDLHQGGLWADAVREKKPLIINDYGAAKSSKGLPKGHGMLQRLLVVPVLREGAVRALVAMANRESAYTEADVETLATLADMIHQVVEHRRAEERLRQSEARYKSLFQEHKAVKLMIDPEDGRIVDANRAAVEFYGWSYDELTQMKIQQINTLPPEAVKERMAEVKESGRVYFEFQHRRADGSVRDVEVYSSRTDVDGKPYLHSIVHDVTAKKQMETERQRWLTAIEQAGEVVLITNAEGVIQYVNPAFESVTGYSREEAIGKRPGILKSGLQDETFYRQLWETIRSGKKWTGRMVNKRKDGTLFTEEATISPVKDAQGNIIHYVAVMRDITEKLQLEQQFHQAQKMESVGRLAGGVAHDYNNSLTIILGFADLALKQVEPDGAAARYIDEIIKAAQRSVGITRQLLAFARKQIIEPVVLDLNETVEGTLKMLRRLIGEDIELVWKPGAHLWKVKLDPAQIDQILANLCVNARDAIGGVGTVILETENVVLSEAYCATHAEVVPGEYVMLAVTDNGCGMDKETMAKIFEPFFTTKEIGKGTGLGLATVYGIVRQNKGFINVYSEPGAGTTFKIYFPREKDAEVAEEVEPVEPEVPLGRGETILLVEDDSVLLEMNRVMLTQLQYHVLVAANPLDALALARQHDGLIHGLMTDVIMPEMNGKELAEKIQELRPEVKVLYMSGYTANVIAHHGVLDSGVSFLQKPFGFRDLAMRIRQVLDAG
jgi:PAS domain S-box-containing protein